MKVDTDNLIKELNAIIPYKYFICIDTSMCKSEILNIIHSTSMYNEVIVIYLNTDSSLNYDYSEIQFNNDTDLVILNIYSNTIQIGPYFNNVFSLKPTCSYTNLDLYLKEDIHNYYSYNDKFSLLCNILFLLINSYNNSNNIFTIELINNILKLEKYSPLSSNKEKRKLNQIDL